MTEIRYVQTEDKKFCIAIISIYRNKSFMIKSAASRDVFIRE